MNFYEFASQHPGVTIVLSMIAGWTVSCLAAGIGKFRFVEHRYYDGRKP